MLSLYKKLEQYAKDDYVPMHMPGHKRQFEKFGLPQVAEIDITEIDGFDDYHYPEGIIRDIEEQASHIYGAKKSFYLVNGSTVGILAAISAVANEGDDILVARNCHKAVYNAVYVNGLVPHYIYPEMDETGILCGISPQKIQEMLQQLSDHHKCKAVVITSPTYEGVVSDIEKIADICHSFGAILIVDAAHGAHFNFHTEFPKTAMECGADLVIESLHKTLPCYTQTAIIHLCGDRVLEGRLKKYLSIYQTSSPSYVFMAGINQCIDFMVSEEGKACNNQYIDSLKQLRKALSNLTNIKLWKPEVNLFAENVSIEEMTSTEEKDSLGAKDYDISKIVLCCPGRGMWLYKKLLEEYHIQLEMGAADYVIAMTSIGDQKEWYERFVKAVRCLDEELGKYGELNGSFTSNENSGTEKRQDRRQDKGQDRRHDFSLAQSNERIERNLESRHDMLPATVKMSPKIALNQEDEGIFYSPMEAVEKIALEWIYAYPPGIPLIYPGELVTKELIDEIEYMKKNGVYLKGFRDSKGEKLLCIE